MLVVIVLFLQWINWGEYIYTPSHMVGVEMEKNSNFATDGDSSQQSCDTFDYV